MRKILITATFLISLFYCCAQSDFTFNKLGVALNENDTNYRTSKMNLNAVMLSPKQQNVIKLALAEKIRLAINTIEDKNLPWRKLYVSLWDEAQVTTILDEMRRLRKFLLDPQSMVPTGSYDYVPHPTELMNRVFNMPIYTDSVVNGTKFKAKQLLLTNPLSHYLLYRLDSTMQLDSFKSQMMDMEYIQAWRELETTYQSAQQILIDIKELTKPCAITSCYNIGKRFDSIKTLVDKPSNKVLQLLEKKFFKSWLWYTNGYLMMNPLGATTLDKRYPSGETISQVSTEDRKGFLSANGEDSLLIKLLTTRNIKNEALIPIQKKKKNEKIEFHTYDASNHYRSLDLEELPKFKDTKNDLNIIVYNVPAKENLSFSLNRSFAIKDQSTTLIALDDALSNASLTGLFTNGSAIISAFQKISPLINIPSAGIPRSIIQYNDLANTISNLKVEREDGQILSVEINNQTEHAKNYMLNYNKNLLSYSILDSISVPKSLNNLYKFENYAPEFLNPERKITNLEFYALINGRKITATKNSDADKINFINASILSNDPNSCDTCKKLVEKCLIDYFILNDRCYELTYIKPAELEKNVKALICRFQSFLANIENCRKKLDKISEEISNKYLPNLKNYVSIIQRSLPPVLTTLNNNNYFEEEKIDSTPDYRTVVFTPELKDPPKMIVYEVVSNLPGKTIDGKNPLDTNFVIRHKFKWAKRHYLDISAGLAYTTSDYLVKSSSQNSLPQITEGERFKPLAGLHFYPLGIIKVDDRLRPKWERISLYVGVSIKNPLENIYPGLSYDIVPGIRLIGGYHYFKDTKYTISGGTVIDQASAFKAAGPFFSLSLEPLTLIKLIGIIK